MDANLSDREVLENMLASPIGQAFDPNCTTCMNVLTAQIRAQRATLDHVLAEHPDRLSFVAMMPGTRDAVDALNDAMAGGL